MATRKTSPPDVEKKPQKVSGRNGNPVPKGVKFTSQTAREAAQKSNEVQARRKSIKQSFLAMMEEEMIVEENGKKVKRTGAEAVAKSIINGSVRNNAKMVELALALLEEKPKEKIDITMAIPKFEKLDAAFEKMHGGDSE